MCYDAPTSIATFAFMSAITLFLWRRNGPFDRAIGLILLVVAAMQLLEFVIWTHLGPNPVNQAATTLIPVVLYSQPLLIALILWLWKAGWFVEAYKYIFYGLLVCLPVVFAWMPSHFTQSTTGVGPTGHLAWPLRMNTVFVTIYNILMLFLILTIQKIPVAAALTVSYIGSRFYYSTYYKQEWPSLWCHAINLVGVVALFP
jgi:hypothetical protein